MSSDYSIEIYESAWTATPAASCLLTQIEVPEGQSPPAVGDVIAISNKDNAGTIHLRVNARTHLATEGKNDHDHVWWKKTWIFVSRI